MCNRNCFSCKYNDCIDDSLTEMDIIRQDKMDEEILRNRKSIPEYQKRYSKTLKGSSCWERYKLSEKYKEAKKRYQESDRARELNKERVRRYREKMRKQRRSKNEA